MPDYPQTEEELVERMRTLCEGVAALVDEVTGDAAFQRIAERFGWGSVSGMLAAISVLANQIRYEFLHRGEGRKKGSIVRDGR